MPCKRILSSISVVSNGFSICDSKLNSVCKVDPSFDIIASLSCTSSVFEIVVNFSKAADKHIYNVTVNRPFTDALTKTFICERPFDFCTSLQIQTPLPSIV